MAYTTGSLIGSSVELIHEPPALFRPMVGGWD